MTKADLIEKVHGKMGDEYTKKAVGEFVDAVFDSVVEAVSKGRFAYPGFGTFSVKKRKAREGRNPRTGATIKIPASKSVSFKAAPKFKDAL